jgi:NAD(P)-dependent dehydrogenase (short-subunit alcohol dehydrogenase family)
MGTLQNKTILVTGAFGLFGQEICQTYLAAGANVTLAGHSLAKINAIQEVLLMRFKPEQYLVTSLELSDRESIDRVVRETVDRFGAVDVLVNNAAIDAKFDQANIDSVNNSRFENFPMETLRRSVEINMLGTIQMTQAVCKVMLEQKRGVIINVGSIYSTVAPNQNLYDFGDVKMFKPVDYVVSKSFIPNFTRYIATFYAKDGIRCNAIAPHGVFDGHDEEFLKNFEKLSPIGRMCEKEELHGPFLFLASDESSYMNGTTLILDGGWTAW